MRSNPTTATTQMPSVKSTGCKVLRAKTATLEAATKAIASRYQRGITNNPHSSYNYLRWGAWCWTSSANTRGRDHLPQSR